MVSTNIYCWFKDGPKLTDDVPNTILKKGDVIDTINDKTLDSEEIRSVVQGNKRSKKGAAIVFRRRLLYSTDQPTIRQFVSHNGKNIEIKTGVTMTFKALMFKEISALQHMEICASSASNRYIVGPLKLHVSEEHNCVIYSSQKQVSITSKKEY